MSNMSIFYLWCRLFAVCLFFSFSLVSWIMMTHVLLLDQLVNYFIPCKFDKNKISDLFGRSVELFHRKETKTSSPVRLWEQIISGLLVAQPNKIVLNSRQFFFSSFILTYAFQYYYPYAQRYSRSILRRMFVFLSSLPAFPSLRLGLPT